METDFRIPCCTPKRVGKYQEHFSVNLFAVRSAFIMMASSQIQLEVIKCYIVLERSISNVVRFVARTDRQTWYREAVALTETDDVYMRNLFILFSYFSKQSYNQNLPQYPIIALSGSSFLVMLAYISIDKRQCRNPWFGGWSTFPKLPQ